MLDRRRIRLGHAAWPSCRVWRGAGMIAPAPLRVAIGGLGTIGLAVARRLDEGIDGLMLAGVSAKHPRRATARMRGFRRNVPVVPLPELARIGDVVVECVPAEAFVAVAEPVLRAGKMLMPLSVGALLEHAELVELAKVRGARIIVPSGALPGLDAVSAMAEGHIESVRMITRKPPGGLAGAPYLRRRGIEIEGISRPLKVFDGPAAEGAKGFPANVNVAAALGLAGIGAQRTELEIWADPTLERNTHRILVEADCARIELKIENVPSDDNPRTGKIVPLSVIAALRRLVAPLTVGA